MELSRILDESSATDIANETISNLEYEGYSVAEMIPGLIQAIVMLAVGDDQVLDEAANLLADGGVER